MRRTATLTAVALITALALTGCAKGGSSSGGGSGELTLWTHSAGHPEEVAAYEKIVSDFNASQKKYTVKLESFPQDSYNQSVTSAASAGKLPCILDVDGPNVPNWAWAGYLAPLTGMDDTLSKFLPSTVGSWNGQTYSYGFSDVALTLITRASVLQSVGARVPTLDQPWTREEFGDILQKLKATGQYTYPADFQTNLENEWWPYAFSPMLQSAGGDLINRTDYRDADGVLNGAGAVDWANWFHGLVTDGLIPLKSNTDAGSDFLNGKTAILYSGSWSAADARKQFGDDVLFLPSVDLGDGAKIGGASWQFAMSASCPDKDGALAYLKFAADDKYVASVSEAISTIPATEAAAALVPGYGPDGENTIFREMSERFAVVRPETPGYPYISTVFAKLAQDILNGADPQTVLDKAVADIDANQKSNNYFE